MAKQSILFSFDSATNRFKPLALIGSQTEAYTESNPIPESVFDNFAYTANYTCYIKNGRAKGLPENEAYVTYTVNKSDATGSGSQEALVVGPDTMKTPRRFMRKSGFIDGAKKWGPWEELMTGTNIGSSSVLNKGVFVDGNVLSEPRGTMNFQASTSNLSALNLEGRGATWVHLSHFAHANNGYAFQMAAKIYNGDPTTTNDEKNWGMKLRATVPTGTSWGPWHNVVSYPEDDNTGVFGYRTVGDWNLLNSGTLMIGAGKGAGQLNGPQTGTDDNGLVLPMFYTNKKKGVQLWYATENEPMGCVRILNNSRWGSWRKIFDINRMFFTTDGVAIKSNVLTSNIQVREPSDETEPLFLNKYVNNPVSFKHNGKYITLQSLEDRMNKAVIFKSIRESEKDILNIPNIGVGASIYSTDYGNHTGIPNSNTYGYIFHIGYDNGYTTQMYFTTFQKGSHISPGSSISYLRCGIPQTTRNEWSPWHEVLSYPVVSASDVTDAYSIRANDWNDERIRKYIGVEYGKTGVKNPPDSSETSGGVLSLFKTKAHGTQLHFSTNYNRLYLRSIHAGTWKPWVKIADGDRLNFLNNGVIIRDDLQVEKIDGYKNSAFVDLLLNTKGDKHVKFKAGDQLISLQEFYKKASGSLSATYANNPPGTGNDLNNMTIPNTFYKVDPEFLNGPRIYGTMHVQGRGVDAVHQIIYPTTGNKIFFRNYWNHANRTTANKWSEWKELDLDDIMHYGRYKRKDVTDANEARESFTQYVLRAGSNAANRPTAIFTSDNESIRLFNFGESNQYLTQIAMGTGSYRLALRFRRDDNAYGVNHANKFSQWQQILTTMTPIKGKVYIDSTNNDLPEISLAIGIKNSGLRAGSNGVLDGVVAGQSVLQLSQQGLGFFNNNHKIVVNNIESRGNENLNLNANKQGKVNFKTTAGEVVSLQDFYNSAVKTSSTNVQTITDANLAIEPNVTYFIVSGGGTNKNLPPDLQDDVFITVYKSGDNLVQTLLVNKNDTGKPVMYFRSKNYRGTVWQEWYRSSEVVPLTLDEYVPNLEDDNDDALEQVSGLLEKFKTLQADNVYSYFMLVNEPAFFRKCEAAMAPRDDHNYEVESSLKGAIPADASDLTNGGSMLFEHHQTEPNVAMQKVTLTNKQGVITGIYTRGTNTVGSKPTLGQWTKILPVTTNQSGGTGTMTVKECVNLNTTKDIGFYKLTEAGYLTIPQNLRPELNSGFGDPYPFLEVYTKDGLVYQRISTMDGDDPSSGIYTLERFGGLSSHDGRFSWAEWNIKEGIKYAKPEDMIQGYSRLEPRGMAEFSRKFITTSMSPFILHIDNHEFFRVYGRELAKPSPTLNISIFPFEVEGDEVDSTPANKAKAARVIAEIIACTIENHRSSYDPDTTYQKMTIYYKHYSHESTTDINLAPITFERVLTREKKQQATAKILGWDRLTPIKNPKTLNYDFNNSTVVLTEDPQVKVAFKNTDNKWVTLQKMYTDLQAAASNSGGSASQLNYSGRTPQEIARKAFGSNAESDFDIVVIKEPGTNFKPSTDMSEVIRQLDRKAETMVHSKVSPIRSTFRNDDGHLLKIENRRYTEGNKVIAIFLTITMYPRGTKVVLSHYEPSGITNDRVNWNTIDVIKQGNRLVEKDNDLLLNNDKADTVSFTHTDGTKHTLQELFQSAADGKGLVISGIEENLSVPGLTKQSSWAEIVGAMSEKIKEIKIRDNYGHADRAEKYLRNLRLSHANNIMKNYIFSPKGIEYNLNKSQSIATSMVDEMALNFDTYYESVKNLTGVNGGGERDLASTSFNINDLEETMRLYLISPYAERARNEIMRKLKDSSRMAWIIPNCIDLMSKTPRPSLIEHFTFTSVVKTSRNELFSPRTLKGIHTGLRTVRRNLVYGMFIIIRGTYDSLYIRNAITTGNPGLNSPISKDLPLEGHLINTKHGVGIGINGSLIYKPDKTRISYSNNYPDITIIYLQEKPGIFLTRIVVNQEHLEVGMRYPTEGVDFFKERFNRSSGIADCHPLISIKGLGKESGQDHAYMMSFGYVTDYNHLNIETVELTHSMEDFSGGVTL